MASTYQEILHSVLPDQIYREIFPKENYRKLNVNECKKFIINSLTNCKCIDWQAYAAEVCDLEKSGLTPAEHFINDGIFEGKKLYFKQLSSEIELHRPLVSVIIVNYNNSIYLDKCIQSVINQTLSNIEIIIVDDFSTDDSVDKIKIYAQQDGRIKTIYFSSNQSQHMAKKCGVKYASGRYIMFLDSDDFYYNNTCEVAYSIVYPGYDIGGFNFSLILPPAHKDDVFRYSNYALRNEESSFYGIDILYNTFITSKITPHITNKIFDSELCKNAFLKLEDGSFTRGEDNYEALALLSSAKSFHFMPIPLYNHPIFMGIATVDSSDYKIEQFLKGGEVWKAIERYIKKFNIPFKMESLKKYGMQSSVQPILEYSSHINITQYFDSISRQYGFNDILFFILSKYFTKWSEIAEKFINYSYELKQNTKIKNIFLYDPLYSSNNKKLIESICGVLKKSEYHVCLLTEINGPEAGSFPDGIEVFFMTSSLSYREDLIKRHISNLISFLMSHNVDLILYIGGWNQASLWQFIVFKYFKIPFFIIDTTPFYIGLIDNSVYDLQQRLSVMRLADQVWSFNVLDETFYRINKINSEEIPMPLYIKLTNEAVSLANNINILVCAAIDDKFLRWKDALNILNKIRRINKTITMIFFGCFEDSNMANDFYEFVRKFELDNNIRFVRNIECMSEVCHGINFGILPAYAVERPETLISILQNNIPCFMYNIPGISDNNLYNIYTYPQGDCFGLSEQLVDAIKDPYYYLKNNTSRLCVNAISQSFENRIDYLLSSFAISSSVKKIDINVYISIMYAISFYTSTKY